MNYGKIYVADVANGPGCRVSLFVSGCTHHCKGCFNQVTWNFDYGELYTWDTEELILSTLKSEGCDGLSILGGEPMELLNQLAIVGLLRRARALKGAQDKSIWLYTGYTLEELRDEDNHRCHGEYTDEILSLIDVLVDGEFIEEEKDITLSFRGSRNQRIIFLVEGEPVWILTGQDKLMEWEGKENDHHESGQNRNIQL